MARESEKRRISERTENRNPNDWLLTENKNRAQMEGGAEVLYGAESKEEEQSAKDDRKGGSDMMFNNN